MTHEIMTNVISLCSIWIILTVFLIFPHISFQLWQIPLKKWLLYKAMIQERKSRRSEEKLQNYQQIDLRELK